jgi:2-polyprenyl-3-methyl-5-hydroxy-6-metoxy-1,4-benzoquinol methylase
MPPLECACNAKRFAQVHLYEAAPSGEVRFPFSGGAYRRSIERCEECTHYVTRHGMDTSGLYGGAYVDATYGDLQGVKKTFERIAALPEAKSDNAGRVKRILEYSSPFAGKLGRTPRILDVGSGLCVFLHRMKQAGWDCTALDPDSRACEHAREAVGVKAIHADFVRDDGFGRFDVIAFNKVLEHVPEPVAMLRKAARYLEPGGFVYVELPDAEGAAREGFGREEFFIEHLHIFTATSFALLVERAGYRLAGLQQIREPSSKYTLRGFAHPH